MDLQLEDYNYDDDDYNYSYPYPDYNYTEEICEECVYGNGPGDIPDIYQNVTIPPLPTWKAYCKFVQTYGLLVIVILGLIGNFLSFLTFIVGPLRKQAVSIYLAVLAISDTVVLVSILVFVLQRILPSFNWSQPYCSITAYVAMMSSFVSIWILVTFTAERYFAICHPIKSHGMNIGRRGAAILMGTVVGVSLLLYLWVPFTRTVHIIKMNRNETKHNCDPQENFRTMNRILEVVDMFLTSVIPCIIIVVLNVKMIRAVHKSQNALHGSIHTHTPIKSSEPERGWRRFFRKESSAGDSRSDNVSKTTRLLIVISSTFVLLNIPYSILKARALTISLHAHRVGDDAFIARHSTAAWIVAHDTAHFIFHLNFAINFVLYCLCSDSFRKFLTDGCSKIFGRKKESDSKSGSTQSSGLSNGQRKASSAF